MKHYYRIKADHPCPKVYSIQRRKLFMWRTIETFCCVAFARLAMANILLDDKKRGRSRDEIRILS